MPALDRAGLHSQDGTGSVAREPALTWNSSGFGPAMSANYPLLVKRDLDGLFGLLLDNMVQLLLIPALCAGLCGMTGENARYVTHYMLPGAAISLLFGNVMYAWQAHRLAASTGRSDVTALPYGINTPSMLVFILFVMQPVYQRTQSAAAAWQMGLVACLGSALIEIAGSFVAEWVRTRTPRAALLSTLAGIAVGFISMQFALQIFQKPLVAMLPLAILFVALFSRVAFPLGLPAGLVAVVLGTACAWLLPAEWTGVPMNATAVVSSLSNLGFMPPVWCGGEIAKVLSLPAGEWLGYVTVIVPMGLFNVIGSLQNIESAAAAGDRYPTMPCMAINGVGSFLAAMFGSCFPTTIYIGHAGWKGLGARAGYSTLNGLIITAICLSGALSTIAAVIPVEAGMAIVLWIGIIITAQAFQTTPPSHAPACAIGLFPAIAAWGMNIVQGAFSVSGGKTLQDVLSTVAPPFQFALKTEVNGYLIHGMLVLERGYILTCMFLAAMAACLIERQFLRAAVWALVASCCAGIGLTHSYRLRGNDIDYAFSIVREAADGVLIHQSWPQAVGYLALVVVFALFGWMQKRVGLKDASGHE